MPITTPNLTFREFLSKMNRTDQIQKAEHVLKQIPGHTIVASKKKRETCARESVTDDVSEEEYFKPGTYSEFVKQLSDACKESNEESKLVITQLAPHMVAILKEKNEWDSPTITIEPLPSNLSLLAEGVPLAAPAGQDLDCLIDRILGPSNTVPVTHPDDQNGSNIADAYANLLTDTSLDEIQDECTVSAKQVQSMLKDLQPYREKPSKDRSKRFAAGELPLNAEVDTSYDIQNYQYWTIYPNNPAIKSANVFILSQIIHISESEKPVQHSMRGNPNTYVMLNVFEYDPTSSTYTPSGRSALLPAAKSLQMNVTGYVSGENTCKSFDHTTVSDLVDYVPFHGDLDIESRINTDIVQSQAPRENDDCSDPFIVEKIIKKEVQFTKGPI